MTFFPSYCVFQDLVTKHMIVSDKECDGIYVVGSDSPSSTQVFQVSVGTPFKTLHQWHKNFGYHSYGILEHFFLSVAKQ